MIRISTPFFSGSKDIKQLVTNLLRRRQASLEGQQVLDVPAGNGDTALHLETART